ncbi:MAG: hypothetical protein KIT58_03520 [Planctomycetota bacterium]|nr:hypothetical protein [Planctomycetota bacterium]
MLIDYDPRLHVLHRPELVQLVIPRDEMEAMANTGGLRAYSERRLPPGRYVACWIGDDGWEFDREVFEIPDLLKQRQQARDERRAAACREARELEVERDRQRFDRWIRDHAAMALDTCRRRDPYVDVAGVLSTARAALWENARELSQQESRVVQRFLAGVLDQSMVWSAWRRA